uniref:Alpha-mannosidase n=1 Tax=Phlebotomus kandelakii TaxID=1109342 RepID=A0A6B2E8D7_9DIPT
MTVKIFRRGSARCIGLLSALVTILLCLYYISMGQPLSSRERADKRATHMTNDKLKAANESWKDWLDMNKQESRKKMLSNLIQSKNSSNTIDDGKFSTLKINEDWTKCRGLYESEADISTLDEYSKFDFQPEWMKSKEYWDKSFEARYEELRKNPERPPLKVIIVPHSHNDPGWLRTYINYFELDSRQILNLIVAKLQEYEDMTFIWSEICILQLWWDQAHPQKQRALKQLVQSGRLEITTGGWVMTDEANVHIYAMVDQLIEGHQWVKNHLNVTPRVGWSIDPFGHGSTVPFLLSSSEFDGTIIQRIHYAWKQWFAKHQAGDFLWKPHWRENSRQTDLLTHNMPFDIYSIKHSCGPHPFICLNFDFRKIPGEYTEYSIKAQFITNENIATKADLLIEQYARTASLFPHNVALIPIGDDFRYNKEREFEQQYVNYKKLVDYINAHKERYGNTEISFGTPVDYFRAVKKRQEKFPTLKGDFFVYSDIFTEGRPAYWSGYYTTRPSYKILSRDLEHNLRSLEILFTIAFNRARQSKNYDALRIFEKNYEKIIHARRNLGLFQHHDAITGTSKSNVMRDYGTRIFTSIQDATKLQQSTIETLLQKEDHATEHGFILSELERDSFSKIPRKTPIHATPNKTVEFVVYNSLLQERLEVVLLRTLSPNVRVLNGDKQEMDIQINPVWNITEATDSLTSMYANGNIANRITISEHEFEIMFVAKLPGLSLTTFTVEYLADSHNRMATIYCNECHNDHHKDFEVRNKLPGDVQLENQKMRLLFDEHSGFLKTVTMKNMGKPIQCAINFGAYRSAQFHSGAYLFKTDPDHQNAEKDVLEQYTDIKILITSGPIASDVTVIYGPFLAHTVRIYNTKTDLDQAVYIENDVDFEPPPKNRETELFMRLVTDIENGEIPEFYSDLNGFQFQKRVKVSQIGIEGNYFPITTAAFIQDDRLRLTLLTNHAQGSASLEPGQLEVMLDRRTLYDDYRGMGEGVVDSRLTRHRFWLLLEPKDNPPTVATESAKKTDEEYNVLSLIGNHMSNGLNYPANIYFVEPSDDSPLKINRAVSLLRHSFPCDFHLLTLRTQTEANLPLFPSKNALLVIQRQGHDCHLSRIDNSCTKFRGVEKQLFREVFIQNITQSSLTGLHEKVTVEKLSDMSIEPMEVRTFVLRF